MNIHLELPYELENSLREQAQQKGTALNQYIINLIQANIGTKQKQPTALSPEETHLFEIINKGFPDTFWSKLHQLDKKRVAELLTESEHTELLTMTEALESANAERMNALIRLATLRRVDIDTLMNDLGLMNGKNR